MAGSIFDIMRVCVCGLAHEAVIRINHAPATKAGVLRNPGSLIGRHCVTERVWCAGTTTQRRCV